MAKKHLKFSVNFWKGLVLGVLVSLIGIFVYFKLFTAKFPPTNDTRDDCVAECTDEFVDCNVLCPTPGSSRDAWDACHNQCQTTGKACIKNCK